MVHASYGVAWNFPTVTRDTIIKTTNSKLFDHFKAIHCEYQRQNVPQKTDGKTCIHVVNCHRILTGHYLVVNIMPSVDSTLLAL
jgi:hypothetical protein